MPTPLVSSTPISSSVEVVRNRTFCLPHHRSDYADVISQFVVLLSQMHSEKFTGQVVLHFSQGSVNNVRVTDSKAIEPT